MNFAALILPLLLNGPELFADGEALFNDIAHGEGGTQKLTAVLGALTTLTGHAATALAVATAAPPPPPPNPVAPAAA